MLCSSSLKRGFSIHEDSGDSTAPVMAQLSR